MLTPVEEKAMQESWELFRLKLEDAEQEIHDVYAAKGRDYDVRTPPWHRMPFGDKSYAHEVLKKADRIVSLLMKVGEPEHESLYDNVRDIAVYCTMWMAYMRMIDSQLIPINSGAVEDLRGELQRRTVPPGTTPIVTVEELQERARGRTLPTLTRK